LDSFVLTAYLTRRLVRQRSGEAVNAVVSAAVIAKRGVAMNF